MYGKSRRTHRREAFVPQHHPCRIPGTNTWQAGIKNGLKIITRGFILHFAGYWSQGGAHLQMECGRSSIVKKKR